MDEQFVNTTPDPGVKRCLVCGTIIATTGDKDRDDEPIVCAVWDVADILEEYDCTISEALSWLRKHKDKLDQAAFDALRNYTIENSEFEMKDEEEDGTA